MSQRDVDSREVSRRGSLTQWRAVPVEGRPADSTRRKRLLDAAEVAPRRISAHHGAPWPVAHDGYSHERSLRDAIFTRYAASSPQRVKWRTASATFSARITPRSNFARGDHLDVIVVWNKVVEHPSGDTGDSTSCRPR